MEDVLTIPEEVQTIEPPQQQDPPLKKLYDGLKYDGKYTKTFDEFRKQYSTPEAIDKLYNGLHEDKDYTKSKEEFQQQYFSDLKKNKSSSNGVTTSGNGLSGTPKVEKIPTPVGQLPQVKNTLADFGIKAPVIPKGQGINEPVSTEVVQPKITASYDDFKAHNQERVAKKKELRKQAVDNAAMKVLKNKGVIKPEEEGKELNISQSQQLTTEKNRLQKALDEGDATFAISKDGELGLKKTIGFWDALTKGWNESMKANDEAAEFADMDAAQKVDFLKKKESEAPPPTEYLGERGSTVGSIGGLVGENAPFLVKAAEGGLAGSALILAAPETLGASLTGLPAATAFIFTANDSKNQGIQQEVTRRFYQLKQENPNADEVTLMQQAEQGTLVGGLAGIATNAALMSNIKIPISDISKGVIGKSIQKAVGNTVFGASATAGIEGVKLAESSLEGIKTTPTEIAKSMGKTFSETATTLGLLHVMSSSAAGIMKLPNIVKSAFKYVLKDADPTILKNTLEANVKSGNITKETAEKVQADLDEYKAAIAKAPNGLSPEAEASVAGLIQAKNKLIAEMKTKDDTAKPFYEEKIEGINQQIQKTVNTGKPYAHEIDEISGEKYTSGIVTEPPRSFPEPTLIGGESETKSITQNEEAKATEVPITETKAGVTDEGIGKVGTETGEGTGEDKKGITHAAIEQVREKIGLPEYEGQPVETHEMLLDEARKEIEKNPNAANESMQKMERGDKVTNKDNAILAIYKAALDIELKNNPSKEIFDRITRLAKALDPAGTEAGKLLESRKLFSEGDTLSDFLLSRQQDKGVPLSDNQIKAETAKYNELQKANEELQAALKIEKEKNAALIAEHGLNKAKSLIKRASKKTKEEYKTEREGLAKSIKEKWKNAGKDILSSDIPFRKQLSAIAPDVKKYVESLLGEGINKLDDIVTAIHADLKDALEGISKADIIDIIGGVHDEVKKTANEKSAELRLIKREAELLAKLQKERLNEKSEKPKTDKEETDQTRRIIALQDKIKEVRKLNKERGLEEPVEDTTASDPEYNAQLQKKLTKRIEELQKDLKNKNYAKPLPTKKPFILSRKSQLLKDRVIQLEKKISEERFLDERSKLSGWEKAWDKFQNVAGIRRVIQTAVDASIWFRQLGALVFNPRKWHLVRKFIAGGSKSVFNQVHYDRIMDAIHKSPDFKNTLEDGVRYNELNAIHPSQQNEFFPKSFAYGIPVIREILTSSQRIADSSLNIARFELYQKFKARLLKKGITRESDPETYKEMAKLVMNTTGSGNLLGMLENRKAEKVLGSLFYGARLMAANFNTLNPVYYAKIFKVNRTLGLEAMKDLAAYTTTLFAVGAAAVAAGGKVSFNPDDSDFIQIRFGGKVYDLSGGKATYIRTFLRWVEAGHARATKSKHEANKALEFAAKSSWSFWRNKAAPNTGYFINAIVGKNSIGQDFDPYEIVKIYPMYADDAWKAAKEDGYSSLLTVVAPNLLGIGYGNYYSEPSLKPIEETIQRNTRTDEQDLENLQNFKEGGRDITDKERDTYISERDAYIEAEIKKLYAGTSKQNLILNEHNKIVKKKYNEMSKEQIVKATSAIKAEATKKVKEKLFGDKNEMIQSDEKQIGEQELKEQKQMMEPENK